MQKNYHTHTVRCHHAQGEDREYVEQAIAAGFTTLGFSDHTPQLFENGYISPHRMLPEVLRSYTDSLIALREEYRDRIEILIGLETEYAPDLFPKLMTFLRDYPIDYLILGQHFVRNESIQPTLVSAYDKPLAPDETVTRYVDVVTQALGTDRFAYIAHPDVVTPHGDPAHYRAAMRRLCEAAKEKQVPLEINFLGIEGHRHYPNEAFWEVAGEVGNTAIFGCDAHSPDMIPGDEAREKAQQLADRYGLPVTEEIKLTMRS